jgi:hypothetical protein
VHIQGAASFDPSAGAIWPGSGNLAFDDNQGIYVGTSAHPALIFQDTASAVNWWEITNSAANGVQRIEPVGSDAAIAVTIASKSTDPINLEVNGNTEATLTATAFAPGADGGSSLGVVNTAEWQNLFLNNLAVINWENGDCLLTHTANTLTLTGCSAVGFGGGSQTPWASNIDAATFSLTDNTPTIKTLLNLNAEATATFSNVDAGAGGQGLILYANSASPAASDVVATITAQGRDSGAGVQVYANQTSVILDPVAATEDGKWVWAVTTAGTTANELELTGAALYPTTTSGLDLGDATHVFQSLYLSNSSLKMLDTGANNFVSWKNGSDVTADRVFTVTTGDADRTLTLTADSSIGGTAVITTRTLTGGVGIAAMGDLSADRTVTFDATEISSLTWGAGAYTTMVWDAGATDPTATFASNSVTWSNAATFSLGTSATFTTGTIELGAAIDTTIARSAAGEATLETKAIHHAGRQTIFIPAGAMKNDVTSPASCGDTYDSGTNDVSISVCAFDTGATEERANFQIAMPKSWDLGTLIYQVLWTNAAGANSSVAWSVACASMSDLDTLNSAMGVAVVTVDAWSATNALSITAESAAMTCANTPNQGDYLAFRILRNTGNASDAMAGDALLLGIKIYYTDDAANDT